MELNQLHKANRCKRFSEIQKAHENFKNLLPLLNYVNQNEFLIKKNELFEKIKNIDHIPTNESVEKLYNQYCAK